MVEFGDEILTSDGAGHQATEALAGVLVDTGDDEVAVDDTKQVALAS